MDPHPVSRTLLAGPAARRAAAALVLLLGVAVRLAFLLQWPRRLNIDESTAGLIGLHVLRGENDHEPLHGAYPTSRWKGRERVRERYEVQLPADLPPGDYEILVGLWNPRTGKRAKVTDSALPRIGNAVRLTRVRVLGARPSS